MNGETPGKDLGWEFEARQDLGPSRTRENEYHELKGKAKVGAMSF